MKKSYAISKTCIRFLKRVRVAAAMPIGSQRSSLSLDSGVDRGSHAQTLLGNELFALRRLPRLRESAPRPIARLLGCGAARLRGWAHSNAGFRLKAKQGLSPCFFPTSRGAVSRGGQP